MDLPPHVPDPRAPLEDMKDVVARLCGDIVASPEANSSHALTMHDMVAHGLIAEEDLEQVKESLSDDTIATIERRYSSVVRMIESMRRQQDALRHQLGLMAMKNEHLTRDLMTDHLTGLGSVKALDARREKLEVLLRGEGRRTGEGGVISVVVMSVDIIDLKGENAISQQAGDDLIVRTAQKMAAHFRQGDIFRRGGDEFIGLFSIRNEQEFTAIFDNMRQLEADDIEKRMRIGYSVALGRNQRSVLEAEQMADPKTHPENRIGRLGESNT